MYSRINKFEKEKIIKDIIPHDFILMFNNLTPKEISFVIPSITEQYLSSNEKNGFCDFAILYPKVLDEYLKIFEQLTQVEDVLFFSVTKLDDFKKDFLGESWVNPTVNDKNYIIDCVWYNITENIYMVNKAKNRFNKFWSIFN